MAVKTVDSYNQVPIRGNREEQQLFTEAMSHYSLAREDLDARIRDFDKKDELFRSHIDKNNWPYQSVVFDPRVFTAITEKTARQFYNKPKGRMTPREGGDALGAVINNELLSYQWDDNERVDNEAMITKWAMMDMNARKYGASFGVAKWRHERRMLKTSQYVDDKRYKKDKRKEPKVTSQVFYDGPDFRPFPNRDCLPNPSYSTIKHWFQVRDWVTLDELKMVNDISRSKPVYKNLDLLRDAVLAKDESTRGSASFNTGDTRAGSWVSKNKSLKGIPDLLGQDDVYRTIEIITEYRDDRWIVFAPREGVIIRDIPNPYNHGQIPVVMLKYFPVDDDLYGLSEIEPVERLQRAINALVNQYLDAINMSLYTPLKIRSTGVQMHTIEFGPGKKWIMNDPSSDIVPHDQSLTGVQEFTSTYSFMVSALQNALGESSLGVSNVGPFQGDKTATEVRDLAIQRNSRDAFNELYLGGAIKKQMLFWHAMNQQFMFDDPSQKTKILRIVSKDAGRYLQKMGLDAMEVDDRGVEAMGTLEEADIEGVPDDFMIPAYPVDTKEGIVPKFTIDQATGEGELVIEPDDLMGNYDYIPDVQSMQIPDDAQMIAQKRQMVELAKDPASMQLLQQEGFRIKYKEILEDYFEQVGIKDASKYFEKGDPVNEAQQPGEAGLQPGSQGQIPGQQQGMEAGTQAMAGNQAQPILS